MNKYLLPLKREIWEHHGSFVKMPVIVMAVLTSILLITTVTFGSNAKDEMNFNYKIDTFNSDGGGNNIQELKYTDEVIGEAETIDSMEKPNVGHSDGLRTGLKMTTQSSYILFHSLMLMVIFSYLLSCLLADRKDNSILFWKSMPVSETQNVMTKIFSACLLLPAIAWIASFVMSVIILIVSYVLAYWSGMDGLPAMIWQESSIIKTGWGYIGTYLAVSLWLLPVMAWFLFASAVAKKNAFLTVVLPILGVIVVERYVLGSHYFAGAFFQHMSGLISTAGLIPNGGNSFMILNSGWGQLSDVVGTGRFWASLPIVVVFVYGAIWLRENRYED